MRYAFENRLNVLLSELLGQAGVVSHSEQLGRGRRDIAIYHQGLRIVLEGSYTKNDAEKDAIRRIEQLPADMAIALLYPPFAQEIAETEIKKKLKSSMFYAKIIVPQDISGTLHEYLSENEHEVSLPDIEFERAYFPVICKRCGTPNILTAEEIVPVESEERGMGAEIAHSDRAYGKCGNCNGDMVARITIWEYPKDTFQNFAIDEEENCKHADIGNLDSLIEDIIWAQEYREKHRE